jgi:hypothetical protein
MLGYKQESFIDGLFGILPLVISQKAFLKVFVLSSINREETVEAEIRTKILGVNKTIFVPSLR